MRKVVVLEHISIDGVIQAPGDPDEDTSGEIHGDRKHSHPERRYCRELRACRRNPNREWMKLYAVLAYLDRMKQFELQA